MSFAATTCETKNAMTSDETRLKLKNIV